jgi:hypothetical protein
VAIKSGKGINPGIDLMREFTDSMIGTIDARLRHWGMEILGVFEPMTGETSLADKPGDRLVGLMVASAGGGMWPIFKTSSQYLDGEPDPLDRWSAQVLRNTAEEFGAQLSMPFDRPFPPFQRWAMRATGLRQSKLGVLIHPRYGLWFGLRGVLYFEFGTGRQENQKLIQDENNRPNICEDCLDKPCLSACPVNAFGDWGFDVAACYSHLDLIKETASDPDCMKYGCTARGVCPVGLEHKYCDEQLQFHMAAFR